MPRIARAVAPGFPHHVVQRGNNREKVFFNDKDWAVYLFLLKKYSEKWHAPIVCYCLMANHVHLIAIPFPEGSLHKMMQGVTLCYSQHMNRKYGRTGRLWESRYHSCIIDQETYLWSVARYIEQNPVRAKLVEHPVDYPYSSASAHCGLLQDPVLGDALFPEIYQNDYIKFLQSSIPSEQIREIRQSASTGRPLGTDHFVTNIEQKLNKRLRALPVGRPKKRAE